MNTCKISKSLSKFLWNFSFTKEEVCFPVNICLPIVTYSTFVFLERTRSRHWRTFTIVWSIRNYFSILHFCSCFKKTGFFFFVLIMFKDNAYWIKRRLINDFLEYLYFWSQARLVIDICHLAKLLSFYIILNQLWKSAELIDSLKH